MNAIMQEEVSALHNLSELVEKTNTYIDLHKNLQSYYHNYLASFIKDVDGVLDYIPEDQHHWYYDTEKYSSFVAYLKELGVHGKTFLVNTVEKYVVPYLANCTVGGCAYRVYTEPVFQFVQDDAYLQVTVRSSAYTNKHKFNRDVEKLSLGNSWIDHYIFCAKTNKFVDASTGANHSAHLISYSNTIRLW